MQTRLLLDLMDDTNFNPIIMWHLYTYHDYDKMIRCSNGTSYVDFYSIEVMSKNNIKETFLVKMLNYLNNTSFILLQNDQHLAEILEMLVDNFDFKCVGSRESTPSQPTFMRKLSLYISPH